MNRFILRGRALTRCVTSLVLCGMVIPFAIVTAQAPEAKGKKKADKPPREPGTFFASEEPLDVTFTTNIGRIRRDKGEKAPWRTATVSYTGADAKAVVVPIQIQTRGIWRLKNCEFPPIRMNFARETSKGSVFYGLNQPKLTSYCRDDDLYEQYLLQELQPYRIYRLLTPISHMARLVHMTYVDSASGKVHAKRSAILYEEPAALTARLAGMRMKVKGATPDDLEPYYNALVGVFEYLIGNTDFSISGLHNIGLIAQANGDVIPIPFDFDFSGVVNARYATTDPSLPIRRVRDRLFRGYCGPREELDKAVAMFKERKDAIYALYSDPIGKLMKPDVAKETLEYYDDFYKTINDPRRVKREMADACIGKR